MATVAKTKIQFDAFVEAARPDAADKSPRIFLQGYVGKSASPDSIRLYADPSLNDYADIPVADIVHSQKITDDPLGLGGSKIWIKVPTTNNRAATAYLEGNLYDDYLRKLYQQEKDKPGSTTIGEATDFTRWTATLATDFTKVAMTDFTKVLATDFTKVRQLLRLQMVGSRACPPWDFNQGSLIPQGGKGYYY
jgi:hypothetical protein